MKKRILLVDDEETLRWTLHEALVEEGYDVENTNDSIEALELVKKAHYDLVISDLKMPIMGGLQLIAEIKKIHPDMKTIVITAYGSVETVIEAMRLGVADFITKPFKIEQIKRIIHKILNNTLATNNDAEDIKNNEGLKIEYDDLCRQEDSCFITKDTTGISNHTFCDFVEIGKIRAILFGCVSEEIPIKNLDVMVKTIFRYILHISKSPAILLKEINQHLCKNIFKRFPISLACIVIDKQGQSLHYSIYGREFVCLLNLPDKGVKVLEAHPFPLNMFPGLMVIESTVPFLPDNKLVLVCNSLLSEGLREGTITQDRLREAVLQVSTANCENMAKGIKFQIEEIDKFIEKRGCTVMVLNLEYRVCTLPLEDVVSIEMPINNYEKVFELFDKKLSTLVIDNFRRYEIITSINEAILNAALFAYKQNEKGEILLKFFKLGDEVIIEVRDYGSGFDMKAYAEPDLTLYDDLTKKSGRGIFIMRQLMDRVIIQSFKDVGTTVHMAKRVSCDENSEI